MKAGQCLNLSCEIQWQPGMYLPAGWLLCRRCFAAERRRHHRPGSQGRPGMKLIYPFDRLKVGETVLIERPRNNVGASATQYGQRWQKQFKVTRHEADDQKCWLTRTK